MRASRGAPSVVLGVLVLVLVVLGVAQLVLPGIAARRLRSSLSGSGRVESVSVSAFPAIELLWHHAGRVRIRLAQYTASPAHLGDALAEVGDAGSVDASAAVLHAGLLTVRDAQLHSSGGRLVGGGVIRESDLRAAVPFLQSVVPVASARGTLVLRGTASLLGVIGGSVQATLRATTGALVLTPDVPFGGLAAVTVFHSPGVAVTGVSAARTPGGFALRATARLR